MVKESELMSSSLGEELIVARASVIHGRDGRATI